MMELKIVGAMIVIGIFIYAALNVINAVLCLWSLGDNNEQDTMP